MLLSSSLKFSHELLGRALGPGDRALDATAGNGKDTLFLAHQVGPEGKVVSIDIQQEAVEKTQKLLQKEKVRDRVEVIQGDHGYLDDLTRGPFQAIAFNLGYLPGSNHEIVTDPETTIKAIRKALEMLAPGGIITVVAYHGHPEGKAELATLEKFLPTLNQEKVAVLQYRFINQANNPPILFALAAQGADDCPDL